MFFHHKTYEWNHAVVTWDGSSTATNVHLYINGSEVSGYAGQIDGAGSKVSDASNSLHSSASSGSFDGILDEARIYNRVLSPDEITRLYNMGI